MQAAIESNIRDPFISSVEPLREIAAYEAMWENQDASFKKIAEIFEKYPGTKPSDIVDSKLIEKSLKELKTIISEIGDNNFNTLIKNTFDYPKRLKDAKEPIEILYYQGDLNYLNTKSIAIVGTRKPTEFGLRRAAKLVRLLIKDDYTIISGLAEGIDSVAHRTAIDLGGRTIAVIGTPLNSYYPKNNKDLQLEIAKEHLLMSQVPFIRYSKQPYYINRFFFPERNKTMSAISEATVIIEAGETSGTLTQARAALHQGRKLFILENNFQNKNLKWPEKYEKIGAIRVKDYSDIINSLGGSN